MRTRFVKTPPIKKYVHDKGRRVSPSFVYALDAFIQRLLDRAIAQHNGGKITIDAELAGVIGVKP